MYLLDTNILSELIKKRPNAHLVERIRSEPFNHLLTSSVCVMELRMGSALRSDSNSFWKKINEEILSRVKIIPIGMNEAIAAGDIMANLRRAGRIVGIEDILIAASAITYQLTVVTANVSHFIRIKDIVVENWLQD